MKTSGIIILFLIIILALGGGVAYYVISQKDATLAELESSVSQAKKREQVLESELRKLRMTSEELEEALESADDEFDGYGIIGKHVSPAGFSFIYPLSFTSESERFSGSISTKEERLDDNTVYISLLLNGDTNLSLAEARLVQKAPGKNSLDFLRSLQQGIQCEVIETANGFRVQFAGDATAVRRLTEEERSQCRFIDETFTELGDRLLLNFPNTEEPLPLEADVTAYRLFQQSFQPVESAS